MYKDLFTCATAACRTAFRDSMCWLVATHFWRQKSSFSRALPQQQQSRLFVFMLPLGWPGSALVAASQPTAEEFANTQTYLVLDRSLHAVGPAWLSSLSA